jgi:hypothetical protein
MHAHPSLPPGSCPAEPLRAGKSHPKYGLFRTETRAKAGFTVPPRWYSNLQKGEGLHYSYFGQQKDSPGLAGRHSFLKAAFLDLVSKL